MRVGTVTLESNLLLAPVAGYCDLAFRLAVRALGGLGAACTDLVNPRGLLRRTRKSMVLVESDPADRPLSIQLYGADPAEMAEAARWCRDRGADLVDINMGCPVQKVCKRRGGAALLRQPELAVRIAERVVLAAGLPATVKMRLGWDDEHVIAPQLAAALEQVGVAAITVHGRTAVQGFRESVRLDGITAVVAAVKRIPVIGNGDVRRPADAREMLERTGCTGVMIGRAALRYPWIFRDTHAFLTTGRVPPAPTLTDWIEFITRHFEHLVRIRGERVGCLIFRQRFSWYARGLQATPAQQERMRALTTAAQYYEIIDSLATEARVPRPRVLLRGRAAREIANTFVTGRH